MKHPGIDTLRTLTACALLLWLAHPALARQTSVGPRSNATASQTPGRAVRVAGNTPANLSVIAQELGNPPADSVLLAGLTFLPLQVSGTTLLNQRDPERPRLANDVPGLAVIELPGPKRVRVLHYRRSSGTLFGFLRLDGRGGVQVLIERLGLDAGNTTDPFETVIGVSDQGAIVISAPTFSHGVGGYGDCWLFPATQSAPGIGPAVELTGPAQLDVAGGSLTFKDGWVYAAMEDRLHRAPADGSGLFEQVVLPPSGGVSDPMVVDELALSGDGSTLVALAGADENFVDLYVIDAGGVPRNLTNAPAKIEPPGYLPDGTNGPLLVLNHDGSLVAYVIEFVQGGELFLRSTAAAPSSPEHVTRDAIFDQSIDNVSGIFGSGVAFRFFADSGLDNADLYQATLESGGLSVINLTQTSGSPGPFFPNAAQINVAAAWQVGELRLLVDDRVSEGAGYEFWIADDAATLLHVPGLEEQPVTVAAGDAQDQIWLTSLRTPSLTGLLFIDGSGALQGLPLLLPSTIRIEEFAPLSAGREAVLSLRASSGLEYLIRLDLLTGGLEAILASPFADLSNLMLGDQNQLLFTTGTASGFTPRFVDLDSGVSVAAGPETAISRWLR